MDYYPRAKVPERVDGAGLSDAVEALRANLTEDRARSPFDMLFTAKEAFSVEAIKRYANLPFECSLLKSIQEKGGQFVFATGSPHGTGYDFDIDWDDEAQRKAQREALEVLIQRHWGLDTDVYIHNHPVDTDVVPSMIDLAHVLDFPNQINVIVSKKEIVFLEMTPENAEKFRAAGVKIPADVTANAIRMKVALDDPRMQVVVEFLNGKFGGGKVAYQEMLSRLSN